MSYRVLLYTRLNRSGLSPSVATHILGQLICGQFSNPDPKGAPISPYCRLQFPRPLFVTLQIYESIFYPISSNEQVR
jgi:hypothetical protein